MLFFSKRSVPIEQETRSLPDLLLSLGTGSKMVVEDKKFTK